MERAVDTRLAGHRLAHQPSGVEREDDLLVALGVKLLGQQLQRAARVCFQSIVAPVHAGAEIPQRMKLRAVADVALRIEAEQRVRAENNRSASSLTARTLGVIGNAGVQRRDRLRPDQPQRTLPAHPDSVQPPSPRRMALSRKRASPLPRMTGRSRRVGSAREAVRVQRRTRRAAAEPRSKRRVKPRLPARSDREPRGKLLLHLHLGPQTAEHRVGAKRTATNKSHATPTNQRSGRPARRQATTARRETRAGWRGGSG